MPKKMQRAANDDYERQLLALKDMTESEGWQYLKLVVQDRINDNRKKLETCTQEALPFLQAEIKGLRFVLTTPSTLFAEWQREREREAIAKNEPAINIDAFMRH